MRESWDERYRSGKYSTDQPHRLLIELVENFPAGRALDLACGTGRNANFLAARGWQVTAVDNSAVGLSIAAERARAKGVVVEYRRADLEKGEFEIRENAYDLVCDFYYLQRDLFPAIKKGVRPGGVVAAAIHIYGAGEEPGEFMLKEGELREFFREFKILHYHETPLVDEDAANHHRRTAEIVAQRRPDQ